MRESQLRILVTAGLVALWGGTAAAISDADKCEAAKLKTAAKYSFCRLKAEAKTITTGDPVDYSTCDTKYGLKWGTAESNGGGMCPTNGDQIDVQNQITGDADFIALKLSGVRFVDNGDGTVSDVQTGLTWEMKIDACPANYTASGTYTTNVPTSGTFTLTIDANAMTWTGSANDSVLGMSSCAGTVAGTSFTGTCLSGAITLSGMINCGLQTVSITISGAASGSGNGTATSSDFHDVYGRYSWAAGSNKPDGTAFSDFLGTLNGGTSPDGVATSGCFAGNCDWRLPTIEELQTILLSPGPCGTSPCIDSTFGPTQSSAYWSATTDAGNPFSVWFVNFDDGSVNLWPKSFNGLYARAVRGGL